VVDAGRWPLRLVDTAGLRETTDLVERLGIEVSERYLGEAAVVLACGATVQELAATVARVRALSPAPVVAVRTKADLSAADDPARSHYTTATTTHQHAVTATPSLAPAAPEEPASIAVSAEQGTGLRELLAAVEGELERRYGAPVAEVPLVTRARHARALGEARDELRQFAALWDSHALPATIAAIHVRSAVHALESLVGSVDVEDVLDRVFSTFCVGK
jgi:tRNA modification GTPase